MNYINIEDIMMRNQALVVENQALRLRIEDLKNGFEGSCVTCEPVGELNKKLRDEFDLYHKTTDEDHIDYRLRVATKRTDLPKDVLLLIGDAYGEIMQLQRKLNETQKELSNYAMDRIAKFDEENGLI
jgi:regulator of replication initiation timing